MSESEERKLKYFAYGSNMDHDRMRERRVKIFKSEWANLRGWRLEFNKKAMRNPVNEGYANIMRDNNSVVEGILYEILEDDIKSLDIAEGYPAHYDRIKVKVSLKHGQEVEAITYVAKPDKIGNGLKPSREYLEHLLKACPYLTEEYCEKLRKTETLD
jgi:cation transport regulator ChaC